MTYLNDLPDLDELTPADSHAAAPIPAYAPVTRPEAGSPAAMVAGVTTLFTWCVKYRRAIGFVAYGLIAATSIAVTVGAVTIAMRRQGTSEIVTEAAPESQAAQYDLQRQIVLGNPVPVFNEQGQAVGQRPASTQELLDAAKAVMSRIEDDVVQEKANELELAIAAGRRNESHFCYGLNRDECVTELDAQIGDRWQSAIAEGNLDQELLSQRLAQALDRVRQGDTQSVRVERDLYLLARERYAQALAVANDRSADGIAGSILERQSESNNQGEVFGQ
ncbi:MAG: hypothetical protein AAFO83_03405 [Cyanobacteria bacterium J06607_13]